MPVVTQKTRDSVQPQVVAFRDFSGGLDSWTKDNDIAPNSAWFSENCWSRLFIDDSNTYAALCSRPGLYEVLPSPDATLGELKNLTYLSTNVAVTSNWVFATKGDDIYATQWPSPLGWTLITTVAGLQEMRGASLGGLGIITVWGPAGVGGMFSWDGAVLTPIVGSPNARFITLHKQRIFVSGPTIAPFRIQYSNLRDPLTGYATNFMDEVDDDTGWQITGMVSLLGSLFIFTGIRIYILSGSSEGDFRISEFSRAFGCSAPNTLQTDGTYLYFLSNRGFMRWNTNGEIEYIGQKVWPFIRGEFDPNTIANAVASYHNWGYYTAYPTYFSGGLNNRGLNLDLFGGGWFPTDAGTAANLPQWTLSSMLAIENGLYLLAGSAKNGKLYQIDFGPDDDGFPINVDHRHSWIDGGDATQKKSIQWIEVLARVATNATRPVTINVYRDLDPTAIPLTMTPDVGLTVTGRDDAVSPNHNRSIVLFRARPQQDKRDFNLMSWGIKRDGDSAHVVILGVKVFFTPNPKTY